MSANARDWPTRLKFFVIAFAVLALGISIGMLWLSTSSGPNGGQTPVAEPMLPPGKMSSASTAVAGGAEALQVQPVDHAQANVQDMARTETPTGIEKPTTEVHYLKVRAFSNRGETAVGRQSFAIPEGWTVVSTEMLQRKGRVRTIEKDGHIIAEAHAVPSQTDHRAEAFANLKIEIQKIQIAH